MKKIIITYYGGSPAGTPEAHQEQMKQYMKWQDEHLAAFKILDQPLFNHHSIRDEQKIVKETLSEIRGFTEVHAESLEAVIEATRKCPFLETGGHVEVAEVFSS